MGTNLVRLSQLEGVDVEIYKETVLPRILEQVANCKDAISQGYLMDCIIHVFPDDFHLQTLEAFLQTCTQLKEKVNVRTILDSMMERLAQYADGNPAMIPSDIQAFNVCCPQTERALSGVRRALHGGRGGATDRPSVPNSLTPRRDCNALQIFNECITKLLEERTNLDLAEMLRLQKALLNFALKCYPGNLDYVNHCLGVH